MGYGVTPVVQPSGTDQALRDKCEELADDVRALSTLIHSLRSALISLGAVKGSA